MSRPAIRLLATSLRQTSRAQRTSTTQLPIRCFTQTSWQKADESGPNPPQSVYGTPSDPSNPAVPHPANPTPASPAQAPRKSLVDTTLPRRSAAGVSALSELSASLARPGEQVARDTLARARGLPTTSEILAASSSEDADMLDWATYDEPFHFHIYGHKHNTHITVTKPTRDAIISISAGQIGFRKAKRGTYDAAYQLCAYVIDKLNQGNWHRKIHKLEVVLRGFGSGREAATKVLLGNEGKFLRPKITMVSDATRLKFGGTRSKKPRRLG